MLDSDIHYIISSSMGFKEPDDISDSPSRISENDELLRQRKCVKPKKSNLSTYICSAFVLLLIITILLLLFAFYQIRYGAENLDNRVEVKYSDQLVTEDSEKLNYISRKLSSLINAKNMQRNLEILARKSHIAGTREQTQLMHFLADEYSNLGFSVKIFNYTVLLNYPQINQPNTVEFRNENGNWITLSYGRGTPLGPEEAVNEQQDIRSQQWWNAYSANGSVVGKIVYCNYGTKDDYDYLEQMGVNIHGRIGLIRYGGIKRSEKIRIAQIQGLKGVLLFSDPIHYSSTTNKSNVFPYSILLPGEDAQRGSVLSTHGDPLTPLLPSTIYTHREETEESAREKGILPKILVSPISYNDAKKIMDLMDGDVIKASEWKGEIDSIYRLTGEQHYRLTVRSRFAHRTITNVIATLKGIEEPDRWVLVGNHVDAWGSGAIDPISGTATQLEIARVMSEISKENQNKRTLVFCHWDAEEFGLIGSTEWIEEMQHILHKRALAYINVDHIAGKVVPDVKSVPLMYRAIVGAAKKTKQLDKMEKSMGRHRLFDSWRYYRGKGPVIGDRSVPELGLPSPGSDYFRFISFLGIPSADLKIDNVAGMSYPLYHTMYETPWMVKTLMDPNFESFSTMANFWAELTHRLTNSLIIPFDVIDYATVLTALVNKVESHLNHQKVTSIVPSINDQLFLLKEALKRLNTVAKEFHNNVTEIQSGTKSEKRVIIEVINNRLQELEQCFIDWTSGNQLNRHMIFSRSKFYSNINFMASIQDYGKEISLNKKHKNIKNLCLEISKLHLAVESAIKTLTLDLSM